MGSNKCVNLPGIHVHLPPVSKRDRIDIEFGIEQNVDMIFASFIRDADSVRDVRKALGSKSSHILVISKIENDLGVRKYIARVFFYQMKKLPNYILNIILNL